MAAIPPFRRCWLVLVLCCFLGATAPLAYGYVPGNRWSLTASGLTGGQGSPATLTWSIARDGTNISGRGPSNLVSFLDDVFKVAITGPDLRQRPWFDVLDSAYNRWSQLGGLTFQYEPNDDGSTLQNGGGVLGVRGDIRLGGADLSVEGAQGGTLAFASLPNVGDQVYDTSETNFFGNSSNNYRALRNTIMHETGHSFGLNHVIASNSRLLLEPFIDTSFDGPQLDDIRGVQGQYGDFFEKSSGGLGNDVATRATPLGALSVGGGLSIGADAAGSQFVASTETDFVSIDTNTDADFYSFTIAAPALLDVTLQPLGGVFLQGVENGAAPTSFDANGRNDLALAVIGINGTSILASANDTGLGGSETLGGISLTQSGQYYVRVTGSEDALQLYQLSLSAGSLATVLAGDYNDDGRVDAADYTVWRDNVGATPGALPNDVVGGVIGAAQYNTWKQNFGATSTAALVTGPASTVPEPAAWLNVALLAAMTSVAYRMTR